MLVAPASVDRPELVELDAAATVGPPFIDARRERISPMRAATLERAMGDVILRLTVRRAAPGQAGASLAAGPQNRAPVGARRTFSTSGTGDGSPILGRRAS